MENKADWILDVCFKENVSRIRGENREENVVAIRRFCLNLCKHHPRNDFMACKIKQYGWNEKFRTEVIFG